MTSESIDATREYKDICCAGIGCRNRPSVSLRIIIVDKKGRFCKSCGDDFIKLGIADPLDGGCGTPTTTMMKPTTAAIPPEVDRRSI
jgi:hypothetical protein